MQDPEAELAEVYLQPGEMFLAREPTIIRTLLGSCVGVTFWSESLGIGALCHAMLPRCPDGYSLGVRPEVGYRYVDFCIRDLARKFDGLGAHRSEVQVKLFGGADVLLGSKDAPIRDTVGSTNCDTALEILRVDASVHLDDLLEKIEDTTPSELIAALFELEMLGLVKQLPGKNFVKVW